MNNRFSANETRIKNNLPCLCLGRVAMLVDSEAQNLLWRAMLPVVPAAPNHS